MAIMRVEKNNNYTVMANHHLRDKRLSLKAKGLLSVMISLPPEWDFTLAGLACISREGIGAIRAAVQELEENGYIIRTRLRNQAGQLGDTAYTIYEFPQNEKPEEEQEEAPQQASASESAAAPVPSEPACNFPALENPMLENPTLDNPTLENPALENPMLDNPTLENPTLENCTQLNKDILNTYPKKDRNIPDVSYPHPSNVYPSLPDAAVLSVPVPLEQSAQTNIAAANELPQTDPDGIPIRQQTGVLSEQQKYPIEPSSIPGMRQRLSCKELTEKIRDQIDYQVLIENGRRDEIDNIVSIMVEVMSTRCEYFTISGKQYPAELVHQRYSQITYHTVQYVLECMHKCGSDIRNIKQYLIATLFNAPATCDSYYSAAVRRDFEYLRL